MRYPLALLFGAWYTLTTTEEIPPMLTPSTPARTHRLMAAALDLTSVLRGAWSIEQTADSTGAVLVRVRIDAADWPADFPRLLARAGGADVQTDGNSYLSITDRDGTICCYRAAVRMARGRAA